MLITGGSRGLGLVMARDFASRGARIAIVARDADELERARTDIASIGGDVYAKVVNPFVKGNEESRFAVIDRTAYQEGRRKQGLAAAWAAAHERGSARRQSSMCQFIEPGNTG